LLITLLLIELSLIGGHEWWQINLLQHSRWNFSDSILRYINYSSSEKKGLSKKRCSVMSYETNYRILT